MTQLDASVAAARTDGRWSNSSQTCE